MIFDGDCCFCSLWIRRWQQATGDEVDYVPFQDPRIAAQFPELSREQFQVAVQLIEPEGAVFGGAEAVLRALAHKPHEHWLLDWYYRSPTFARAAEWGYGLVARHRTFFSALTRLAWGRNVQQPTHFLSRWIFLRCLGFIYLIAFLSLWTQIAGLVGSRGITPAKTSMTLVRQQMDAQRIGLDRYHLFPTLCWLSSSDSYLNLQCAVGAALAVLLILGIAPAPCLFLLWLIYLSLSTVCVEFLSFQWDILLLQTGFLAIFLAPLQLWPRPGREAPPSRVVLWLLRWLLFQLMFESGCVKLASGDPTWRHLTALNFHYETQPLPTWIAWYAQQLPGWAQRWSTIVMFAIELVVPFLIFAPRRLRRIACGALVFLQGLIMLTGNYCFFNLLTIALCLLLLDDAALKALVPSGWRGVPSPRPQAPRLRRWPRQITVPLACVSIAIGLMHLCGLSRVPLPWPRPFVVAYIWLSPLRTFNSYGLFAVMTTTRLEIIIEGSEDGEHWLPYEFKYKPGDVRRRPRFVEPHQPRLDWQMWFAALSDYRRNPWLVNFCVRLLQGSPSVLALLGHNPFPTVPPRFIRAVAYDYHFTDFATRRKTGAWWRREKIGEYLPPISLREVPSPDGDRVAERGRPFDKPARQEEL
jgi:predicted DCC family thiol-disulfide oxidoreductase YuxK